MPTNFSRTAFAAALLTAAVAQTAMAQPPAAPGQPGRLPAATGLRAVPVGTTNAGYPANHAAPRPRNGTGYVRLNAPMYPSPQPNIPYQMGSTMITNQALAPHEMLYPHHYRAMYPPFYYRVKGGWKVTPWGVRSTERWELMGTEVDVKYHGSISPFAKFSAPLNR